MPKRSYFCPDSFVPDDKLTEWAKKTFKITNKEVLRQLELMLDHEFRRPYSSWERVFRNWLRKADQIQTLERERQHRKPQELSKEQRQQDIEAFERDMKRLRVVK